MSEKKVDKSLRNNPREILTKQISYRMHLSFFSPQKTFLRIIELHLAQKTSPPFLAHFSFNK